jgi:hypothetical protein
MREYKACSVCGITKPNTNNYFHIHTVVKHIEGKKTTWHGLRPDCKECRNKKKRLYHLENKDHNNMKCREYYHKHKEKWKKYRKTKEHKRLKEHMDNLNKRLCSK